VYVAHGVVYGCATQTGRAYRLGSRRSCLARSRVDPVTVVGGLAAYGLESCGVDTASAEVVVRRLSDGKMLLSVPAIAHVLGPESFQTVRSIVAKPDGAVAWISGGSSIAAHRAVVEVHRADAQGQTLLDSGAAITAGSLRLHGSTVTWSDRGRTRSATLS
jgi:hypothetical protein